MTISQIYKTALYLAEKTDDDSGLIDEAYQKQHSQKALELIRQCISKFAYLEGIQIAEVSFLDFDSYVPLPTFVLKSVIPYYVAAILCQQDGESEKYNILIYEYQEGIKNFKHDEAVITDCYDLLDGLR